MAGIIRIVSKNRIMVLADRGRTALSENLPQVNQQVLDRFPAGIALVSPIIHLLIRRLRAINQGDDIGEPLWNEWLQDPIGLTPWQTWTLLGFVRHRQRNQFVADVMRERLQGDEHSLATAGAFGHPEIPQSGVVPGLIEWRYYFHGRGCCLTHRTTGEAIDVDFFDETADWIDEFFYTTYLQSLHSPRFVEQRLLTLHPSVETIAIAVEELANLGLLEQFADSNAFRLTFPDDALNQALETVAERWEDASVQWAFGAAVGDGLLLHDLATGDNVGRVMRLREQAIDRRTRDLMSYAGSKRARRETLTALHEIGSPQLPKLLAKALQQRPSGEMSSAVSVIAEIDDPRWCDDLEKLLRRLGSNGQLPEPHIWLKTAEFLVRHGRLPLVEQQIPRVNSHVLGEVAILTLEHFPQRAVQTFRRALRSEIPINRITAAAALAILDEPWSRQELLDVLQESDDWVMTTDCRSALIATHSPEAHQLVQWWEHQHPRQAEEGPYISMDEAALRQSDERINWEMKTLHDRVIKLRGVLPGN